MRIFKNTTLIFMLLVTIFVIAGPTKSSIALIQQNDEAVGIGGYSPVSYFQRDKAERGMPEFQAEYEGVKYYLTDTEQLKMFNADPQSYLPAHGGWCSLMMSGSGNLTPANPESYKIVDGKLLLFWSGDYKGQAISGLSNWHSKTDGKAAKESKRLKKANKTWEKLVQGKNKPNVLVFSPADDDRLNQAQRKAARKQY